ncbi:HD-GYP domain-containing protein [Maridesulfovibrio ferrireducens]|uniref:HD-GYP domain-containing protein n=1 Tax=Maridesulfovibrio ferrireducens TaxID=246191 RepID=UPI001A351F8B|nr:HD domain-containing phosphohydrolase [Maridesulfovibrio ferrireducens]MBI9110781.1 metal-dependent phosphohydrolase [Maridesulfovibrio ferrireducens]
MNKVKSNSTIEESYCSISSAIFKFLPKTGLPFCLYRMNPQTGQFSPATTAGKTIISAEKLSIFNDCEKDLIFIKSTDISDCKPYFATNLETVITDMSHSISDEDMAQIIIEGLKDSSVKIFKDSLKKNFEYFHTTLTAAGELVYKNPDIIWDMLPLLCKDHSLTNKSISNGIIGAGICLHGREGKPDMDSFMESLIALFLCDIGMICLPDFVLGKEFSLSIDEQKRIRNHPINSVEILSLTHSLTKTSLRAILEHHERMDGSGYPRGVTCDQISWLGKLCGAVDSFVAMTMERPGKKSMTTVNALKMLYKESALYDPNIIYALEKVTYRE